jgi:hypothetical protein
VREERVPARPRIRAENPDPLAAAGEEWVRARIRAELLDRQTPVGEKAQQPRDHIRAERPDRQILTEAEPPPRQQAQR